MFLDRSIWRLAAPLRGGRTTERSERSAVRCWAGVAPVWELVWLNRARIAVQSVLFGQSPEMCYGPGLPAAVGVGVCLVLRTC